MAIFYNEGVNKRLTKYQIMCPPLTLKWNFNDIYFALFFFCPKNISDYKVNTTENLQIIKNCFFCSQKDKMKKDVRSLKGKNFYADFLFILIPKVRKRLSDVFIYHILQMALLK